MLEKKTLRERIQQNRKRLASIYVETVSKRVVSHIIHLKSFNESKKIGLYFSNDGEINPAVILKRAESLNKQCYMPALFKVPFAHLAFYQYTTGDKLTQNRFGIAEPVKKHADKIAVEQLDLVLVPLVAFDTQGNRLGRGAGYYDRTFSFLLKETTPKKRPCLIGLAYEFQHIPSLQPEEWDIPLDYVVTEKQAYCCK